MELTLNEYQKRAMSTCMPSCDNFAYMSYGLIGEVGELMGKIAKHIRKENVSINKNELVLTENYLGAPVLTEDEANAIIAEVGDCLWFIAGIAKALGWPLEEVASGNLDKLAARKAAGTIVGNGDGIIRDK